MAPGALEEGQRAAAPLAWKPVRAGRGLGMDSSKRRRWAHSHPQAKVRSQTQHAGRG